MLFSSKKPVIGMIHVEALPGTPASRLSVREIEAKAVREAKTYRDCGVHGVALENMHDTPYLRGEVGPEITAVMTNLACAVKEACDVPCGIQILAGANHEAMAVAQAAGLDFIRAEGFAFAHVADEGFIQSSAAKLLRYRKEIGAERVQVWADVKKKHSSHAITADVNIGATAEAVEFMRGDAVIITGSVNSVRKRTSWPPNLLRRTRKLCSRRRLRSTRKLQKSGPSPPRTQRHPIQPRRPTLMQRQAANRRRLAVLFASLPDRAFKGEL